MSLQGLQAIHLSGPDLSAPITGELVRLDSARFTLDTQYRCCSYLGTRETRESQSPGENQTRILVGVEAERLVQLMWEVQWPYTPLANLCSPVLIVRSHKAYGLFWTLHL